MFKIFLLCNFSVFPTKKNKQKPMNELIYEGNWKLLFFFYFFPLSHLVLKIKKKNGKKTGIKKSPSLSTVEQMNDSQNTDREILVFKYLKTIERLQNLSSLSLYNMHTSA